MRVRGGLPGLLGQLSGLLVLASVAGSHPTSARDHGAAFRQDPAHAGAALPGAGACGGPGPCGAGLGEASTALSSSLTLTGEDLHAAPPASAPEARSDAGRLTLDSDVIRAARLLPKNLAHGSLEPLARELKRLLDALGLGDGREPPLKLPESLCPKFAGRYRTYAGDLAAQTQRVARSMRVASETDALARRGTRQAAELRRWLLAWAGDESRDVEGGRGLVGATLSAINKTMLRETDTATGTGIAPGATKPAHPRADDSVGAVVAHVRREADAWLQLRLHAAQEDLKRAIVTANVLAQWLPLAHADIEACHRGDAPRPVPWAWPSPAAAPHPEWTDDDRIQQMIARVQLDVVRARHRLYGDARKVQAASSENDREVARQKVADLCLLHGALDLAAQKRGDLANMTARLATLHGERKSGDCEGSPGGKCDQLVRAAAALRRAKATMSDADICDAQSRTSCSRCTRLPFCGWCAAERACLEGDGTSPRFGPKCAASWYHGLHPDPDRARCPAPPSEGERAPPPAIAVPDLKSIFDPECARFLGAPGDCERAKLRMQAEETKCLAEGGTPSRCEEVRKATAETIAREQMKKQWDKRRSLDARARAELKSQLEACAVAAEASEAAERAKASARRESATSLPVGFSNQVLGLMQLGELGAGSRTGGSVAFDEDARTGGGGGGAPQRAEASAPVPGCRRMLEDLDLARTNVVASGPLLLLLLEERAGAHAGSATGGEGAASGRRGATGSAAQATEAALAAAEAERAELAGSAAGATGAPATSRTIDDASGAATGLAEEEEDPESGKEGRAEDDAKEDEEEDRLDREAETAARSELPSEGGGMATGGASAAGAADAAGSEGAPGVAASEEDSGQTASPTGSGSESRALAEEAEEGKESETGAGAREEDAEEDREEEREDAAPRQRSKASARRGPPRAERQERARARARARRRRRAAGRHWSDRGRLVRDWRRQQQQQQQQHGGTGSGSAAGEDDGATGPAPTLTTSML